MMIRADTQQAAVAPEHVAGIEIDSHVHKGGQEKFWVVAHLVGGARVTLSDHATKDGAERRLERWMEQLATPSNGADDA